MEIQSSFLRYSILIIIIILMIVSLTLSAVSSGEVKTMIKAEALMKKIDNNENPLLLDIRRPYELTERLGYIKGIVNIPTIELASKLSQLSNDKNREIILICRSDHRARNTLGMMQRAGYKNAKVLEGGMIRWNQLKYPVSFDRVLVGK